MLQMFIDESGRPAEADRPAVFLLAGFLASSDDWLRFSQRWAAVLEADKRLPYFKMTDFFGRNETFKSFSPEERRMKFSALKAVVQQLDASAYAVVVDADEYCTVMKKQVSRPLDKPLYFAAEQLTRLVLQNSYRRGDKAKIEFIYDKGSPGAFAEIQAQWLELRRSPATLRVYKKRMGYMPREEDDKDVLPLQAADMLAGQVNRYFADHILGYTQTPRAHTEELGLKFKARGFRRHHVQAVLKRFLRAMPDDFTYEDKKARAARLLPVRKLLPAPP